MFSSLVGHVWGQKQGLLTLYLGVTSDASNARKWECFWFTLALGETAVRCLLETLSGETEAPKQLS